VSANNNREGAVWQHTCADGREFHTWADVCKKCGKSRPEAEKSHEVAELTRTLRDEFAMAALTGIMSNSSSPPMGDDYPENNTGAARVAYLLANAMLTAREGV